MNKLFVGGCSVSDYTNVDVVYGEILAKKLNYDYIHEGAGCGSNWRIWRKMTNYILNGKLTPDDLLIIQYTNFERREFWSNYCSDFVLGKELKKQYLRERYKMNEYSGDIIRFKTESYFWQESKQEKKLHKLYENNFLNEDFEKEIFDTQHLMFQCLLKEFSIPTIFLIIKGYADNVNFIPFFESSVISFDTDIWNNDDYKNDCCHFNEKGHMFVADILFNKNMNRKYE